MFRLFKKRKKAIILGKEDFQKIIDDNNSAIIMFGAAWCGACKMQKPIINDVADHHKDSDIIIAMVDTDAQNELSAMFQISALPTTIALKGKDMVFRKKGLIARRELEYLLKELQKIPE